MSDFAFFRFNSLGWLDEEEQNDKDEIIRLTEEVLHAHGLQCDETIARMSEEQLREILEEVRKLRKKKKGQAEEYADGMVQVASAGYIG